ncbi:hypothetical protein DSO57_1025438 [Entomophthora muscae]|uniref:Uncharacterized protein n=1 Tax=Entomophthora muscae TaxID=34485 RepID=A0ACC2SRA0_9FUNG|nr:hypothetical protein DSO57_1025438 [Entomophthora muscae]
MKEIPTASPLPNAPPTQDFSKLGFVYITVLGLADQVVPHTGNWRPLATALNYLVYIELIVYMAFQARPASPVGVQPDSGMGCDRDCHALPQRAGSLKYFHYHLPFETPACVVAAPQFYVADLLTTLASVSPFLWFWYSKILQLLLFLASLPDDKTQLKKPFSSINKELVKIYNLAPLWARPYIILASHGIDPQEHTPTTYTNQKVVLNILAYSSPPPTYAQAHFTAYRSELSADSQKAIYLAEKLTGHYRDWFSSHSISNPGILQSYDLFVSSLLSLSGEDKELSTPSASQFAGLTQGLLPLGKYNRKFCSLQSRLQASNAEACSFYKIGLNRLLQEFLPTRTSPTN